MSAGGIRNILVDANVFYARALRDWVALLSLRSGTPLFEVRWTQDILAEVVYHLRKKNAYAPDAQIGGVRRKVEASFPNGEIAGFTIDPSLPYTDAYDAHLHAAAVHGRVEYVVTDDKKFAEFADNDDIPYEVYTADDFLVLIDQQSPVTVIEVMGEQLRYFHRTRDTSNLPDMLARAHAPQFAACIRRHLQEVDVAELLRDCTAKA